MVAVTDITDTERVTSVSITTIGHAMGGILGTFVYFFFMTDYLSASM
jgi:hypothetical protein